MKIASTITLTLSLATVFLLHSEISKVEASSRRRSGQYAYNDPQRGEGHGGLHWKWIVVIVAGIKGILIILMIWQCYKDRGRDERAARQDPTAIALQKARAQLLEEMKEEEMKEEA
jgi:hypothetical protein